MGLFALKKVAVAASKFAVVSSCLFTFFCACFSFCFSAFSNIFYLWLGKASLEIDMFINSEYISVNFVLVNRCLNIHFFSFKYFKHSIEDTFPFIIWSCYLNLFLKPHWTNTISNWIMISTFHSGETFSKSTKKFHRSLSGCWSNVFSSTFEHVCPKVNDENYQIKKEMIKIKEFSSKRTKFSGKMLATFSWWRTKTEQDAV